MNSELTVLGVGEQKNIDAKNVEDRKDEMEVSQICEGGQSDLRDQKLCILRATPCHHESRARQIRTCLEYRTPRILKMRTHCVGSVDCEKRCVRVSVLLQTSSDRCIWLGIVTYICRESRSLLTRAGVRLSGSTLQGSEYDARS